MVLCEKGAHLRAVALLAERLLVVEVGEAEGQAHGVEAQQLQPVHNGCKVQGQAVRACTMLGTYSVSKAMQAT